MKIISITKNIGFKITTLIKTLYTKLKYIHLKSTNKTIISYYNVKDISTKDEIFLGYSLSDKDLNNFIYIKEDTKIIFNNIMDNEIEYINKLTKYLGILKKHNKKYNIQINIENRELLNKSNILNQTSNINLTIYNCFTKYTKEEYLENENKLDELIKPIKESNLSPYEKYLATYNIVKQYKEYKENKENPSLSRSIKYILDKDNEYMVCVGYSDLLTTLLNKLDIPSISIPVMTDTIDRTIEENKNLPSKLLGHQRNLIKIDDEKYNIHGIYISDATWDNDLNCDLYSNASITFDKKKESYILEELEDFDFFLDFHNFDEFTEKINIYLRKQINSREEDTYQEKVISGYRYLYYKIMTILLKLDYQKYQELYNKYDKTIKKMQSQTYKQTPLLNPIEDIYTDFLTEYARYIIPLSNNKIDDAILYEAATNVKRVIDTYTDEELKVWYEETKEANQIMEEYRFPYIYNPNEKRNNYLESKPKILIKEK